MSAIIALNKVREMLAEAKRENKETAEHWQLGMDEYAAQLFDDALIFDEGYICALEDVIIELEGVVKNAE